MYVETRISSSVAPGTTASAYVRLPLCVVGRVDTDVVDDVVPNLLPHPIGEAEAPAPLPVRGARRYQLRAIGERPEVLLQLGSAKTSVDGFAVAENVQRMVSQVDEPAALSVGDPSVADVPFGRHFPVEDLGTTRHLGHVERDDVRECTQGVPDAVSGEAAQEREQPLGESHRFRAEGGGGWQCALSDTMEVDACRRHGASGSFRQVNASAKRSSAFASIPRKRMRPRNVSASNQCLWICVGKCRCSSSIFSSATARAQRHVDVRPAEVAVELRHLVLEDEAVAKRIPS